MIDNGLIELLYKILGKASECSEYTTEYGVSLLMNLCLGRGGIKRLEKLNIIELLLDLLEHQNLQVRTYVNGSLYSILNTSASLKKKAISLGIADTLNYLKKNSEDELSKQIAFILATLNQEVEEQTFNDDEEEEDLNALLLQEVENEEIIDVELEEESLTPKSEQMVGEELLCNFLATNHQATEEKELLMKPKQ